ncbi:tether containing UBX domain for GLUT4 [Trichomycterus rosablanca]|uniref:tether containing UBX domain for GLUT4 n=1 Tax=Trichomycterus rosablanca TaxID=2290929 RepID=UPI002F35B65B
MAASTTTVSVLAPNGRRQTVKVSPNTPLLQILEEVSKKLEFNPDDYGLKFQRNVLDLTLQWRFASLPNNAKLEVVTSTRARAGAESMVRVALQLEDGSRLQGSFSSGLSLWELLNHFSQTRIPELELSGSTPVCVYMRDEVSGQEALKKTTFRSLGLTGGSAIVRYVVKESNTPEPSEPMEEAATPTDPATASNASEPSPVINTTPPDQPAEPTPAPVPVQMPSLPSQSSETAAKMCQAPPVQQEETASKQQPEVQPKTKQTPPESRTEQQVDQERPGPSREYHSHSATPSSFVPFSGGGQRLGGSGVDGPNESSSSSSSSSPPKAKKAKASHDVQRSAGATCGANDSEEAEEYLEPVDREPFVFHLDTAAQRQCDTQDLPDEFFEVTVDDIRKRFAQLKSERRTLEEAPLMTQSLREAQKKEKMDRYPKVVIRVQFPDRRVLQGFFRPLETVAVLRQFVRTHLQDPEISFYLFIAPPKTILDNPSATFFQANLFPAALVYFGSDVKTECFLRSDLVDSTVSALQADELIAGCMPRSPHPSSGSLPPNEAFLHDTESNEASRNQHGSRQEPTDPEQSQVPKPARTDPAKVPKWLKLPGKK